MAQDKITIDVEFNIIDVFAELTPEERSELGYKIWDEAETEIFEIESIVHLCLTGKPLSQVMEEELDTSWLDD